MRSLEGWGAGMLGVLIFSGSLPATRVAVAEFSPLFLTCARAAIAAFLGAALLGAFRQKWPSSKDFASLTIVALGVVVGFPLLTALALQHITAAHSVVYIGLLPLATAAFGVLRGGERPRPLFWLFACLGAATVAGYALAGGGSTEPAGDLLMLAAILVCGLGYAEGAAMSRRLGGWQVICFALLLSAPLMTGLALATAPTIWPPFSAPAWVGFAYVSIFSMLIGFVFWYRGLAIGGIASVSQLQLLQPFFGLALAAALLGESVHWTMLAAALTTIGCVGFARRFA